MAPPSVYKGSLADWEKMEKVLVTNRWRIPNLSRIVTCRHITLWRIGSLDAKPVIFFGPWLIARELLVGCPNNRKKIKFLTVSLIV